MERKLIDLPYVSVLLAVRDDASHAGSCLEAMAAQDYPGSRMELIVADGGSTDATPAIVATFAQSAPFSVRQVENPQGTTAAGLNAALRQAQGDVVVILGARAIAGPSFIANSVATLLKTGAAAVGGVVEGRAAGVQAEAVALALGSRFGVGDARYRYAGRPGEVDTVNYGAYRRELFTELGGFDETMVNVEDDEFNYRLRASGRHLFLSPSIRCYYLVRPTILGLARQYGRYGYPKVRVLRRHPRQMRPRQFIPALFVGSLLVTLTGSVWSRLARRLLLLVLGAYVVACSAASLAVASRKGMRYLPLLPLAFAGMHVGYGLGSLAGSVRFGLWPAITGAPEPASVPTIKPSACRPERETN